MVRFYTNKILARYLGTNLAKWKRWSREFLPPDPLGGLQSGYARQYSFYQAFRVYIGGVLVSRLKFTIPEALQVLSDIGDWLEDPAILHPPNGQQGPSAQSYQIFISRLEDPDPSRFGFSYCLRGTLVDMPADYQGHPIRQTLYREAHRPPHCTPETVSGLDTLQVLNITAIAAGFTQALNRKA